MTMSRVRVFPQTFGRLAATLAATALAAALAAACGAAPDPAAEPLDTPAAGEAARVEHRLVIHGGAGTILRDRITPELEAEYRAALEAALLTGHEILAGGGTALDAVEAAIRLMEDSPLFNAGRGAVFTAEGTNELDASIMDGATRAAGAVAGVKRIRNPIALARLVMERSAHVFMAREGAEVFGAEHGIETVPESYFYTEMRWRALEEARRPAETGTVGAVALDRHGNLAAGTSTGGMTNKRFGRIGDSPVIGAGTYADNESCAVSATGHGEYFIRNVVAYDVCARVRYAGVPLADAADAVIMRRLVEQGATGGIIALDARGEFAMPFNTPGMYRGHIGPDGRPTVLIWED